MLDDVKKYAPLDPADTRLVGVQKEEGIEKSLWVLQTPFGYRRTAELFRPAGDGPFPVILYVHWYEPEACNSNRRQFVDEAVEFARQGAICLTVEMLWSDLDFFLKRTQADDERLSIEEAVNLRRFIDFLLAQPGVDPGRFALVGHDFGGMYGALAGALDQRPSHYVLMAVTPRFPDWYLILPKLDGEEREAYIRQMAALDPITHMADLAPAPVFFQFGDNDGYVPLHRADEFFAAAREPKEKTVYQAGHGLNDQAAADRKAWLKRQLGL
ncbi:MAG: alpha/beta hydrolase family protein [Chloroflexota bacterium]